MKKLKVELLQVEAARASLELRIEEKLDEIARIKESIEISEKRESELKNKINNHKEMSK